MVTASQPKKEKRCLHRHTSSTLIGERETLDGAITVKLCMVFSAHSQW